MPYRYSFTEEPEFPKAQVVLKKEVVTPNKPEIKDTVSSFLNNGIFWVVWLASTIWLWTECH